MCGSNRVHLVSFVFPYMTTLPDFPNPVLPKFRTRELTTFLSPLGFGLRASHRLFEMFRTAGIHDIAAKMPRGRNPMNSVKACLEALMSQKNPSEIAIGRGKKLVDLRNVYYGGNVY